MSHIYTLLSLLVLVELSCWESSEQSTGITRDDEKQITAILHDYNKAWLEGDSSKILTLFADTATLIPSGLEPVKGKDAITKFWWPNDSSKTTINSYDINVLNINGNPGWASSLEDGRLTWSYEKGPVKFSRKQSSYEITIFKKDNDRWKIVSRIWTDRNAQMVK
jgi:ketosteroid isomerase-like protein